MHSAPSPSPHDCLLAWVTGPGPCPTNLPKDHRAKSTWQHVEKELNAAALGEVDTIDVAVPLQMVLSMEGVECRPK